MTPLALWTIASLVLAASGSIVAPYNRIGEYTRSKTQQTQFKHAVI